MKTTAEAVSSIVGGASDDVCDGNVPVERSTFGSVVVVSSKGFSTTGDESSFIVMSMFGGTLLTGRFHCQLDLRKRYVWPSDDEGFDSSSVSRRNSKNDCESCCV